jgi:hypothetical protein
VEQQFNPVRRQPWNPEKPPCFPPAKKSKGAYNQKEEKKAVSGWQ